MPFYINGSVVGESNKWTEFEKTPLPAISYDNPEKPNSPYAGNTLLVLQRESAFIQDESHVAFVGTKNLRNCVCVFMRTASSTLLIHCDQVKYSSFSEDIARFPEDDIEVMILGGMDTTISRNTVGDILSSLIRAGQLTAKKVRLTSQLALKANESALTGVDEDFFVFNYMYRKLPFVAELIFQEKSLEVIDQFHHLMNQEKLHAMNFKQRRTTLDSNRLLFMAGLIINSGLGIPDTQINATVSIIINMLNLNADMFIAHAVAMFSNTGFSMMQRVMKPVDIINDTKISNLVFDRKNGQLTIIPEHFSTEHELWRTGRAMPTNANYTYHRVYDSTQLSEMLRLPQLSSSFIQHIKKHVVVACTYRPLSELERQSLLIDFGFSGLSTPNNQLNALRQLLRFCKSFSGRQYLEENLPRYVMGMTNLAKYGFFMAVEPVSASKAVPVCTMID
ncbi:MAG: hypothetical protein NTW08_04405 [Gammaproteobacteria bacterium]|nr:hypothetical protein [Gammaproteobacteria bacterium]